MNRMPTFVRGSKWLSLTLAIVLPTFFVVSAVSAATVISTSIVTAGDITTSAGNIAATAGNGTFGGTLGVTGLSSLGQASSTMLSARTAYFGGTATTTVSASGNLVIAGATAITSSTSTVSVGCIQMYATSSETSVHLVLSPVGATSTFSGTAYWGYGACQ